MPPGVYYRWNVDQLREWIAEGRTHQWIGEQLGRNPKLVSKACKRFGIQSQRRGPRSGPGHPEWKGGRMIDKNGDKQDNRIENLELFQTNAEHLRDELTGKCPNWSEEGYKRMRKGHMRWREECHRRREAKKEDDTSHLDKG